LGFVVGFHWDKARKNDQSDHLNWDFFLETLSACRNGLGLVAYEEQVMDTPFSQQRVTELLTRWSDGDDAALAELTPLVYEELRRLAHRQMSAERPDHTLQTTALVNEAYVRMADQRNPRWQNRAHFFAVAARAMRRILVSYARSQRSQKRGGGALKVDLDEAALVSPEESKEIVDLHEALERLATLDSRKAQVVELKYFGGLNYDEMAEVLKISPVTVRRDWRFAKAWLYAELQNAM
jgi:RNA polymerase sigma factor (TIGR02999 family)